MRIIHKLWNLYIPNSCLASETTPPCRNYHQFDLAVLLSEMCLMHIRLTVYEVDIDWHLYRNTRDTILLVIKCFPNKYKIYLISFLNSTNWPSPKVCQEILNADFLLTLLLGELQVPFKMSIFFWARFLLAMTKVTHVYSSIDPNTNIRHSNRYQSIALT